MQIRLSLRRSGATLTYGIPLWYRITAACILGVVALAMVVAGGTGLPGWILLGISIFAALYEERWVFDTAAGTCQARMGLVFLHRGPRFAAEEVASIRVETFIKGALDQTARPALDKLPLGSQARLILELKDGQGYMLDSVSHKRRAELEASALELAAALGVDPSP